MGGSQQRQSPSWRADSRATSAARGRPLPCEVLNLWKAKVQSRDLEGKDAECPFQTQVGQAGAAWWPLGPARLCLRLLPMLGHSVPMLGALRVVQMRFLEFGGRLMQTCCSLHLPVNDCKPCWIEELTLEVTGEGTAATLGTGHMSEPWGTLAPTLRSPVSPGTDRLLCPCSNPVSTVAGRP